MEESFKENLMFTYGWPKDPDLYLKISSKKLKIKLKAPFRSFIFLLVGTEYLV